MWRGESLAGPGHKDAWWMTGLGHATRFLEPIRRPLEKARPFALSVAALLVLLLPLVEGLGRHSIGVDARHKDGRWVIVRIDPESTADLAGLRIGDVVLALDGVPPGSRRITDPGLALSAARELTVLRGTEPLTLHLNPAQARWHHVIEPMLMQLVALVFWSLAAFVRIVKPKDDLALRFQWLNLAIALILALSSAADDDIIWAKVLNVLAFSLLPALFLGFFLRFAQGTPLTRQGFFLIHGLAFAGLAVGALYLATGLLASNWYDLLRALLLIPSALAFFGGLMLLVRAHSRSRSRHTRQQLRVVLVGTAVAVLPLTLLSLIPEALGRPPLIRARVAALAAVAFPASFAYAILRHRLMDMDVVIQRTLVYGVMTFLLAGCYTAFLYALLLTGNERMLADAPLLSLVLSAAVALTFVPVRDQVRRFIDRLVYRDRYDYVRTLRALASQLASAQPLDRVLSAVAENLRRAMNLRGVAILLRRPDGGFSLRAASGDYRDNAHIQSLLVASAARGQADPAGLVHSSLSVPLTAHGHELGLLYLGPKRVPSEFDLEDVSLAETTANQLALAMVNELLVEQLEAKLGDMELLRDRLLHVQEEERKRLSQGLHDGTLHVALELVRRIRALAESPASTQGNVILPRQFLYDLADRAQEAVHELRGICTELYPSELAHLGLSAALEDLARRVNRDEDVLVHFSSSFPGAHRLPGVMEDTLYRVARELLDNICRHSGAHVATVTLSTQQRQVVLSIQDDGCGFAVPASFRTLLSQGHIGLLSARQQVERLHGELTVDSAPGAGTLVRVRVPVQGTEEQLIAKPLGAVE